MQESCSYEADQNCLSCQRPQKTVGGEITNKSGQVSINKNFNAWTYYFSNIPEVSWLTCFSVIFEIEIWKIYRSVIYTNRIAENLRPPTAWMNRSVHYQRDYIHTLENNNNLGKNERKKFLVYFAKYSVKSLR